VAAPFRYNNFGGAVGGPIWVPGMSQWFRERLFFFVAEDWIRYRYEDWTDNAVPTALMRQGNFSELLSPNPWYSGSRVIYQPSTCAVSGSASCVPFPGNIIPASRISPQASFFLPYLPTPNTVVGSTNYSAATNGLLQHNMRGDIRVDPHELEDVRWFPRDALPNLPTRRSIARWIIENFK